MALRGSMHNEIVRNSNLARQNDLLQIVGHEKAVFVHVGNHEVCQILPHSLSALRVIRVGLVHEVRVRYRDILVELTFGSLGSIDCP